MLKKLQLPTTDALINIAILVTCGVVVYGILGKRNETGLRGQNRPPGARAIVVGQMAATLPGVQFKEANANLVLYLRSTCSFCTKSMPFYKRLVTEISGRSSATVDSARLIAVGPEPATVLREYLDAHGVSPSKLVGAFPDPQPTPTLVLVDSAGIVQKVWVGQQDETSEASILRSLR